MNALRLLGVEAWNEFCQGLRSGVVALIFLGMTLYLLMVLTNGEYLAQMGSVDVPRNAPNLIYMMTSGDSFFLFFALAWVFAQPIVRDRAAQLHEVMLTMPVSLPAMLWGRYLGAVGVGLVLGMSQVAGFLLAPVLEIAGLVPTGSVGPTPWVPLLWSVFLFSLPVAAGVGALYMVGAIRTRSTSGPFALSAVLILIWMVAMVVMGDAGINPGLATVLDPSGFADAERLNSHWTPLEKSTAIYPVSAAFLLNRLIWGVLPMVLLAWAIHGTRREVLVLESQTTAKARTRTARVQAATGPALASPSAYAWSRALWAEIRWQHAQLFAGRSLKLLLPGLVLLGICAVFVHALQHVDGPFEGRPEFLAPMLSKGLYLVIAFIAAGVTGLVMRRDHKAGFTEMLDAAPAPVGVTLVGRISAVLTLCVLLMLTPALSVWALTAFAAPHAFSIFTPLVYQLAVYGPGLLELVTISILAHALIRRSGPAYTASMLLTFVMIVNHEAELITYPPFELGIPAHLSYSLLTGWLAWLPRLLVGNLYKVCTVIMLLALAALFYPRGLDSRLSHGLRMVRSRVVGLAGVTLLVSTAGMLLLYQLQTQQFRFRGLYETRAEELVRRAAAERRWLAKAGTFQVAGGVVEVDIDTHARRASGKWTIEGVQSGNKMLLAGLPDWFALEQVTVNGQPAAAVVAEDHMGIALVGCNAAACTVGIEFNVAPRGWSTEGDQHWLAGGGVWAEARQILPRLGANPDERIMSPVDRRNHGLPEQTAFISAAAAATATGVAPAGEWRLRITVDGATYLEEAMDGPLDFVVATAASYLRSSISGFEVLSDHTRSTQLAAVAADADNMQRCVARRLGMESGLKRIAQRPNGIGDSVYAGQTLLLAEHPHWDIAGTGAGRWQRQVEIARLLAEHLVDTVAHAKAGSGARSIERGIAGAVALACVAEHNDVQALQTVLSRTSERVVKGLGASQAPVTELRADSADEWARHFAPVAAFTWVARASAPELQALLRDLRDSGNAEASLARLVGTELAALAMGVPLSSDVSVAEDGTVTTNRQRWAGGGWGEAESVDGAALIVKRINNALQFGTDMQSSDWQGALMLDAWPAWERTPEDNLIK